MAAGHVPKSMTSSTIPILSLILAHHRPAANCELPFYLISEHAVTNATVWVKDRLDRQAKGTATKPFFLIVSIWNPHDSPISYPGQNANISDILQVNSKPI